MGVRPRPNPKRNPKQVRGQCLRGFLHFFSFLLCIQVLKARALLRCAWSPSLAPVVVPVVGTISKTTNDNLLNLNYLNGFSQVSSKYFAQP